MKIHQLINSYDLELIEPPCSPGAATWSARAHLQDDITEVLPYLNAELKGASYNHDSTVLIWEAKGKNMHSDLMKSLLRLLRSRKKVAK
jgi:hypothetical protein